MTVRRGDRHSLAHDDEDDLWDSDDEYQQIVVHADEFMPRRPVRAESPSRQRGKSAPVHPSLTNFGPQTLTEFLREQIKQAKAEGSLGKGKGKEKDSRPDTTSVNSARKSLDQDYVQRSNPRRNLRDAEPARKTRIVFTDNALQHLHAQSEETGGSTLKLSTHSHTQEAEEADYDSKSTSTKGAASSVRSFKGKAPTLPAPGRQGSLRRRSVRRSIDYSRSSVPSRTRGRRNDATTMPPPPSSHMLDGADSPEDSPPRYRKTSESLSHLSPKRASRTRSRTINGHLSLTEATNAQYPNASKQDRHADAGTADEAAWTRTNASDDLDQLAGSDTSDEAVELDVVLDVELDEEDGYGRAFRRFQHASGSMEHSNSVQTRLLKQRVILESLASASHNPPQGKKDVFDYSQIVPEQTPKLVSVARDRDASDKDKDFISFKARATKMTSRRTTRASINLDDSSDTDPEDFVFRKRDLKSGKKDLTSVKKLQLANDPVSRTWNVCDLPTSTNAPPFCPVDPDSKPANQTGAGLMLLNVDLWTNVVEYLSAQDVRNVRSTCSDLADDIAPIMVRSIVGNFGTSMFGLDNLYADSSSRIEKDTAVISKYGSSVHKFGISFEYDLQGLCSAAAKVTEKQEQAWYGSYRWPTARYPRFKTLQELEDLVDDNRPLLKNIFSNLRNVSELALSLDSGHGWLEGPDVSDIALYERRAHQGSKIFGRVFDAEDVWHAFGRNEYFKWAQQNSINESLKALATKDDDNRTKKLIRELKKIELRKYDSFREETSQPDFDEYSHTGGFATVAQQVQHPPHLPPLQPAQGGAFHLLNTFTNAIQPHVPVMPAALRRRIQRLAGREVPSDRSREDSKKRRESSSIPAQWPIIFNGHNFAADVGGRAPNIQYKAPAPTSFPLLPGMLTEAQAQWLMETVWAQRAFLSAYTTSIIHHKQMLRGVHSLIIAKISSGLLPSLAQREFWASLPALRRLKILVSPDWRTEHMPGDKFHMAHMPISPLESAIKFAGFLQNHVAKLEKLSHLTIGYVGGGEHGVGMFARNQHLLSAPITTDPRSWVMNHVKPPDPDTIFKFDHIRDLTFENCWFSPCMLEGFMEKSHDTSLHTLVLDSVSMLSKHSTGIDGPMTTLRNNLRCRYDEVEWLHEELPTSACWVDVLDKITPGLTIEERKYNAGILDNDITSPPQREFRGNTQRIVLKSCGYAKISGVKDAFNQNSLVVHIHQPMDMGLAARKARFERYSPSQSQATEPLTIRPPLMAGHHRRPSARDACDKSAKEGPIMMSMLDSSGQEYFGLGTLTQCVHPIEKRVLEQAWGMRFGWGDDIKRWASVEDGCFEGGTGRFSGVIGMDDGEAGTV